MADPVAQYLERHARPEIAIAEQLDGCWDGVVVIPAMAEGIELFSGLGALAERRALVICVINQPAGAPSAIGQANRELLEQARASGPARRLGEAAYQVSAPAFDLVLVDRASPGNELPDGQGVGLARRIGLDLALALHAAGRIAGDWLHTTDADVELPSGYLEPVVDGGAVALTYPYWHRDGELDALGARALALYEISLRYYVLGNVAAGLCPLSAIGSTLAVRPRAYAEVRGVPQRLAGEDFYLLAKLAKVGRVVRPPGPPIAIRGRREVRTPFGTAPAIARIAAALAAGRDHTFYEPESFERLAELRRGLDGLAAGEPLALGDAVLEAAFAAVGGPALVAAIAAIDHPDVRRRQTDQWLDALKALRLIHELRAAGMAEVPWRQALERAPFIDVPAGAGLIEIRQALAAAEDALLSPA